MFYDDVVYGFKACSSDSISEEWEYDHGRFETCICSIVKSESALLAENQESYGNLKTLVKIELTLIIKDKQMQETRYYICDEEGLNVAYFNALVRRYGVLKIIYTGIWM